MLTGEYPYLYSMSNLVTINLVVRNGEKWLRHCLDSIKAQTYKNLEIHILDNASTDSTRDIIKKEYPELHLIESQKNFGMWGGHEELWKQSHGKYVIAISVDIIIEPDFVEQAVKIMDADDKIGLLQAKIYQWHLEDGRPVKTKTIDTLGFKIFRSRRLINIGHGEQDNGQYDTGRDYEIFGIEGAVPIFRRVAIEESRILGEFADRSFFWYGDDFDFAWRMRLFGWKQVYSPRVIAYHDRQTTKSLRTSRWDFIKIRKTVPILKRRLDWRNGILTLVKNDYVSNVLRDFPWIFARQFQLFGYFLIFEPTMILELFTIAKLLPIMLKKRREVMRKATVSGSEIRQWFVQK